MAVQIKGAKITEAGKRALNDKSIEISPNARLLLKIFSLVKVISKEDALDLLEEAIRITGSAEAAIEAIDDGFITLSEGEDT